MKKCCSNLLISNVKYLQTLLNCSFGFSISPILRVCLMAFSFKIDDFLNNGTSFILCSSFKTSQINAKIHKCFPHENVFKPKVESRCFLLTEEGGSLILIRDPCSNHRQIKLQLANEVREFCRLCCIGILNPK